MTDIEEALEWAEVGVWPKDDADGECAKIIAAEVRRLQALEKSSREALAVAGKALELACPCAENHFGKGAHRQDCFQFKALAAIAKILNT